MSLDGNKNMLGILKAYTLDHSLNRQNQYLSKIKGKNQLNLKHRLIFIPP